MICMKRFYKSGADKLIVWKTTVCLMEFVQASPPSQAMELADCLPGAMLAIQ